MAINIKLPKLETPEVDQHLYQLMLSSLMYVAIGTQPDIMFAMHYLSQFSVAPSSEHIMALKRIYWYLNGTWDLGMTFHGNQCKQANWVLGLRNVLHYSVSKGVIQRK